MTVSYAGNFTTLLLRWRGSLWKSVWKELVTFLSIYYLLRVMYFYAMTAEQQTSFEYLVKILDKHTRAVPLTFLLGFYIAIIVKRWWCQFEWVAWPDDLLSAACVLFPGNDEQSRLKRHTIARYLCLTATLAWREISSKIRMRFPTMNHIVSSGLMTEYELELYLNTKAEPLHWYIPLQWAQKIAGQEISAKPHLTVHFIKTLDYYRLCFRQLFCYDWVCVPLVYTQIAAVATYGYLLFCLIGRQFLIPEKRIQGYEIDYYIPIVTIVEFLFYVGWFKIGQDLMRPFGKDDDDLELSYILDRHIETSFSLVNEVADQSPPLVKDQLWQKLYPAAACDDVNYLNRTKITVPHTRMSAKVKDNKPVLHVKPKLSKMDGEILHLSAINLTETSVVAAAAGTVAERRQTSLDSNGTVSSNSSGGGLLMANKKALDAAKKWINRTSKKKEKVSECSRAGISSAKQQVSVSGIIYSDFFAELSRSGVV